MARPRKEPPSAARVTAADVIAFIEQVCVVPEGRLVGRPLRLMDWQKDLLRLIYDNPEGPTVAVRRGPQGLTIVADLSVPCAASFPVDLDQLDEAVDAEVGEGHDAVVFEAVDPDHAVFGLHFESDVEEEVDVFAEFLGDAVYDPDVRDLVDVHGQAASAATA
jgi:hypothetical protein